MQISTHKSCCPVEKYDFLTRFQLLKLAVVHVHVRPSKKIYMFSVRILKKKEDEGHFIFYLLFFKTAAIF